MKTIILMSLLTGLLSAGQLSGQRQDILSVLNKYYAITEALVNEDAVKAGKNAAEMIKAIDSVSKTTMSAGQLKKWNENAPKIKAAADLISKTTDITKQRDQLNTLSVSLYSIVKVFDLGKQPVYYQYCPMKKAYWLSKTKEVQNPYYGKKMLNCGSTKETIK